MNNLEIERKFLVSSSAYKVDAISETHMIQGFLNTHPERTVRVRIAGDKAYLTIKGKGNDSGTTRFEWETEIGTDEAIHLIDLCEPLILEKVRYRVPVGQHVYEIDEFTRENTGLIVAEIELQHEDESFEQPSWLGEEVTGQIKYYNSQLSQTPFNQWKQKQ